MEITSEDIESIVSAVWMTMLDAELTMDGSGRTASEEDSVVGLIELSGAYKGIVELALSRSLVVGAASVMFEVPARDVSDEQVRDTVAELTNMVGGNVKCLVEQPSQLGLPQVASRTEASEVLKDLAEQTKLGFVGSDGDMFVAIYSV